MRLLPTTLFQYVKLDKEGQKHTETGRISPNSETLHQNAEKATLRLQVSSLAAMSA